MPPDITFLLIVGSYVFTCLNWGFTFWVYLQIGNHLKHRIEELERLIGIK